MGRGHSCDIRPTLICFENEKVIKLSLGLHHCLALTNQGIVYGWGSNKYGQIGCGNRIWTGTTTISKPIAINYFTQFLIKDMFCSENKSLALSSDGLVFIWGRICTKRNLFLNQDY